MPKKKKKASLLKKILIIGLSLIVVQVLLIMQFKKSTNPVEARDKIREKVAKTPGLSNQRREQLRIQLAVSDFRMANGRLPATLEDLIPKYIDKVPIDPETKKALQYVVEGDKFYVGERKASPLVVASTATGEGAKAGPADKLVMEEQSKSDLIASLDESVEKVSFVYDPVGKRDPFRPFDFAPKGTDSEKKTPLEQYDLSQLKLTAVLAGLEDPKATVENSAGRGFIVQKGTKIGIRNGEVIEILPDRIKIVEEVVDFTGEKTANVVEMVLRTKDQEQTTDSSGKKLRNYKFE